MARILCRDQKGGFLTGKSKRSILSGGPAGRVIVHKLRQANSGLSVGLIKDEPINVNRCAVPYGIGGEKPIKKFCIPNALVIDYGAELILDQVVMIDPEKNM